ncbi:MAG: CDP-alcohol phosphatidyltransferase family protein [Thermoprotei archaeon]|nr:MAG: CDP-alcohol phosphatidyltransferase family protein [Thermoprotei archaeon]
MVITRIRAFVEKIFSPFVKCLVFLKIPPNALSVIGVLFSILAFLSASSNVERCFIAILFIALSSLMDILDGMVARAIKKVSRFGSFIDSVFDRVSDTFYILSLIRAGLDQLLTLVALLLSYLISYERAKAESLGIKIEGVGIIERGERVLFVIAILLVRSFSYVLSRALLIILIVLSLITVIQRAYHVSRKLRD